VSSGQLFMSLWRNRLLSQKCGFHTGFFLIVVMQKRYFRWRYYILHLRSVYIFLLYSVSFSWCYALLRSQYNSYCLHLQGGNGESNDLWNVGTITHIYTGHHPKHSVLNMLIVVRKYNSSFRCCKKSRETNRIFRNVTHCLDFYSGLIHWLHLTATRSPAMRF
jgi:hypothetical protein